jgi:5S rRNA maturation endonuclease (ribonuclease M5)
MNKLDIENLKLFFDSWLKEINKESDSNPIIVEGKKDLKSLRILGVKGQIYCISGRSLVNIIDELSTYQKIIILTDFDKEGRKISRKLIKNLQALGIRIELKFQNEIKKIVKGKVSVIEGLDTFLKKLGLIER